MQNIIQLAIDALTRGKDVRVSFLERMVFVGKEQLCCKSDLEDLLPKFERVQDALDFIETVYESYKHSRPTERDKTFAISSYFEAIPYDKLDARDLLNESRDVARVRLEITVLCLIMNGSLWWDESVFKGWRYTSPSGLTLKKKWVTSL